MPMVAPTLLVKIKGSRFWWEAKHCPWMRRKPYQLTRRTKTLLVMSDCGERDIVKRREVWPA